mgnify:CR=1 FL=1
MWDKKCPDCGEGLSLGGSTSTFCVWEYDLCGHSCLSREGCADEIRHGTVPEWAIFFSDERFGEHPYDASRQYLGVHVASREVALVTAAAALAVYVRDGLIRGEKIDALKKATPTSVPKGETTLGWTVGGDIGVVLKTAGHWRGFGTARSSKSAPLMSGSCVASRR